jgi:hypothetical protein
VTLSAATAGATIYYTSDGTVPTTSSTQYTGAIPVSGSEVIAAVAIASGYTDSSLAKAGYVITPPAVSGPVIPTNAIAASDLQGLDTWIFSHDPGTPGASVGATSLLSTPSLSGNARQFATSYTNAGGEIYSVAYANDTTSMNFVYDGWVWIEAGSTIANLELDSNQVTQDGQTVIYGFQCSGYSQRWEYSAAAKWVSSSQPCNLSNWKTNAWHQLLAGQLRQCDLSLGVAGWQRASDRRHGGVIVRAGLAGRGGANPVSTGWIGSFGRVYGVP